METRVMAKPLDFLLLQPQNEQPDAAASHAAAGGAGDAAAHGYMRAQRLLWGGAGTHCACQETGEEAFQYPRHSGQYPQHFCQYIQSPCHSGQYL